MFEYFFLKMCVFRKCKPRTNSFSSRYVDYVDVVDYNYGIDVDVVDVVDIFDVVDVVDNDGINDNYDSSYVIVDKVVADNVGDVGEDDFLMKLLMIFYEVVDDDVVVGGGGGARPVGLQPHHCCPRKTTTTERYR